MPTYMADKSALARFETSPEVNAVLEPLLVGGDVATCSVVDLEVLYSAESPSAYAGLTVLHYDADYERIAEVTGQPVQWVVPRGSVD